MKSLNKIGSIIATLLVVLVVSPIISLAQENVAVIDAETLRPHTTISVSPRSGSFVEGTTFEVPVILNTEGNSINSVDVTLNFDVTKLSVVEPSGGQSILGIWLTPPFFDNINGVIKYTGVIPEGITTGAGVIGKIVFRAKAAGKAILTINAEFTRVLLNDGLGSGTVVNVGRGDYTIIPKTPDGPIVFSETHPVYSDWYNNNNLTLSWEKEAGIIGFSYELDNAPNTVPDNTVDTNGTTTNYENLGDGLWYFHIKGSKNGIWGNASHLLVRIDTTPPTKPYIEIYHSLAAIALVENAFISFFSTDNLSGIDHYEVAIIGGDQLDTQSPLFVESTSPYRIIHPSTERLQVIVRAIDGAGNNSDASVNTGMPLSFMGFIENYFILIVIAAVMLIVASFAIYYVSKHHIIARFKKPSAIEKNVDSKAIRLGTPVIKDVEIKPAFDSQIKIVKDLNNVGQKVETSIVGSMGATPSFKTEVKQVDYKKPKI